MQRVRIKKVSAAENAAFPTANPDEYKPGEYNQGVSVPIEYTVEGTLLNPVKEGEVVRVDREKRNGVEAAGLFQTSLVTSMTDKGFMTKNSVYLIEYLGPADTVKIVDFVKGSNCGCGHCH